MVDTPIGEPTAQTTIQKWGDVVGESFAKVERAVGATPALPMRVIVLCMVVGFCVVLSPLPWNLIGGVAMLLLSLTLGSRR